MKHFTLIGLLLLLTAAALEEIVKLGPVPKELHKIDSVSVKLNWNGIVEEHYSYFFSKNDINPKRPDTALATRELTQAAFGGVSGWERSGFWKSYNNVVKPFYRSPAIRMALYKWIKPYYEEAFKELPDWKKKVYKDMVNHAEQYVKHFNYQQELKCYNDSNRKGDFVYMGPKGKRGNFGRMEAFIFRRIHNKEMTLLQISQWVAIIKKDIETWK